MTQEPVEVVVGMSNTPIDPQTCVMLGLPVGSVWGENATEVGKACAAMCCAVLSVCVSVYACMHAYLENWYRSAMSTWKPRARQWDCPVTCSTSLPRSSRRWTPTTTVCVLVICTCCALFYRLYAQYLARRASIVTSVRLRLRACV